MATSKNFTTHDRSQRWRALAPTNPTLPPADYEDFFATAGAGTLVKVWDFLYSRNYDGSWSKLNSIIQSYGEDDYASYERQSFESMAKWALQDFRGVTVLLLK